MFRAMDLRGRAGGNEVTKLPTVHQNSINKLRSYAESGGQVTKISTAGVDGRVVVWDL
jgi:actin related protein 2/3 complex subunit 1A/1B